MPVVKSLYEKEFLWSQAQAEALCAAGRGAMNSHDEIGGDSRLMQSYIIPS